MSRFLGPIHYWLYEKIQVQQAFVQDVIEVAKDKYRLDLEQTMNEKYGVTETCPLEEVIDEGNIHGWLQNQVSITEYKLAYSVTNLKAKDNEVIQTLEALFEERGREKRKVLEGSISLAKLYKGIQDTLLDGMPCDHVNQIVEQNEEQIVWKRNKCIHGPYWKEVGGEVKDYYQLREAWLRGFVDSEHEQFKKIDEVTYKIKIK